MSLVGLAVRTAIAALIIAFLFFSGLWQTILLFVWQHPLLTWFPIVVFLVVAVIIRLISALAGEAGGSRSLPLRAEPTESQAETVAAAASGTEGPATGSRRRIRFGYAYLAALMTLLLGVYLTWISPPAVGLAEIEHEYISELPQRTQPRLLPRTGVRDDPRFYEADEIHLARDPATGDLLWTGEWQGKWFRGPSAGVVIKRLDEVVSESEIVHGGFDDSVAGFGPGTLKWRARAMHPFSRTQYPVVVPAENGGAVAIAPYVGYKGFPIRYPYLKGVLVYSQDGTIEDLTPEEAASRPELVRTGRIVPEAVARSQAEALARSDELEGKIVDGEDNRQPYLTAIDLDNTVWVTIINDRNEREGGAKAVVLTDSSTGKTTIWRPQEGGGLISTRDVINHARALPLQWTERRCCDSDGHSYTVTLREVVEPRLAFKDGKAYFLVTVVPTREMPIGREVEYTLLIDAESGEKLDQFNHVLGGGEEDGRLERFFQPESRDRPEPKAKRS